MEAHWIDAMCKALAPVNTPSPRSNETTSPMRGIFRALPSPIWGRRFLPIKLNRVDMPARQKIAYSTSNELKIAGSNIMRIIDDAKTTQAFD